MAGLGMPPAMPHMMTDRTDGKWFREQAGGIEATLLPMPAWAMTTRCTPPRGVVTSAIQ